MYSSLSKNPTIVFVFKFAIVHTVTYLFFGIIFMLLSNYFDFFAKDPIMSIVMKSSDALSVRLAAPAQLIRGSLIGLVIFPFRSIILDSKNGWLKLFWLLYILTSLGAVITGPGSIEGFLYTNFSYNPLIGVPEITIQMLVFSWFFCKWMKSTKKVIKSHKNH